MRHKLSWAHGFLKPQDFKLVEHAVAAAEKNTSGEIVPMIVRRSSSIGLLPIVLTLIATLLAALYGVHFWTYLGQPVGLYILPLFFVIMWFLSHYFAEVAALQRWLIPKHEKAMQVEQRAFAEFCIHHVDRTVGHTGILIFISLMERQVVVLADKGIASKLPRETWNEVVQLILTDVKKGDPCKGLIAGIHRSGEILAQHFPPTGHKPELSNRLIVKQ